MSSYKLCSLSFTTTNSYNTNLKTLLEIINNTSEKSLVVAPEVCLTGFDYDNFDGVCEFADVAVKEIKEASKEKIIILTIIEKKRC